VIDYMQPRNVSPLPLGEAREIADKATAIAAQARTKAAGTPGLYRQRRPMRTRREWREWQRQVDGQRQIGVNCWP